MTNKRPFKHFPVVFKVHKPELINQVTMQPATPLVTFPRDTNRKARRSRK